VLTVDEAGAVNGALAVAASALLIAGCASASSQPAATHANPKPPTLATVLASVPPPPGAMQVSTPFAGHFDPRPLGHDKGSTLASSYWTSKLSMNATLAWITAHMGPTWSIGPLDKYNLGRLVEWDAPASATEDGPNVSVNVTAKGNGADVEIDAWTLSLGHRSADETLAVVTGATAKVTNGDVDPIKPFSVTLTTAQAQRMAAEINASRVYPKVEWLGFAGTPDVTVTFDTSAGRRSFLLSRDDYSVQPVSQGPELWMSAALNQELDVDIPKGAPATPAPNKHPLLPTAITSATFTTGQEKGLSIAHPAVTGAALRRLVADLRALPIDKHPDTCTKKGALGGNLVIRGSNGLRQFLLYSDCDEVTPESVPDGQIPVPFIASPALEADLARILR
jgi:hypothetical protein